jgi:SAM-dependent methyltransferase
VAEDIAHLAALTQEVYERNAARFDAERSKGLHERPWIDRLLRGAPPGGSVLDLGCGAGDPIAAYIAGAGFAVTGFDASRAMLDLARRATPDGDWRLGDMRALDLPERFDRIIGWNSFFHLMRDEQRAVLPRLAAHLAPGGALMLTVGPGNGEVDGHVGDDRVYHSSLTRVEYAAILGREGLTITDYVAEDPDCAGQTVFIARKPGTSV